MIDPVKLEKAKNLGYKKLVEYEIKPTDTVRNIAVSFRMELTDLIKLNPEVCTPFPQAGINLLLPIDMLRVTNQVSLLPYRIHLAKCLFYETDRIYDLTEVQ